MSHPQPPHPHHTSGAYGPPPGWTPNPQTPPTYGPPSGATPPAYGNQPGPQPYGAPAYAGTVPGYAAVTPPAHAGYPPAPHGGAPATAGQFAPAANPQMQFTACRFCGSVPAVDTTFRGHQGMLVLMRFLSTEGPFCRDCGLGVFRHMTSRTLVQGWYGYASLVITPVTVLLNLARRGKVARLTAPQPNPFGPSRRPMDPGPRLLQRPLTWIGAAIPLAVLVLIIVVASSGS